MIDIPDKIRDFLLSSGDLTALTSTRIWAERNTPPPGYTPAQGGAIAFKLAGGPIAYSGAYGAPRVQFKCYGSDAAAAQAVYRALYDALKHGGGAVKSTYAETFGQTLEEEGTGWIFVLMFASFWVKT